MLGCHISIAFIHCRECLTHLFHGYGDVFVIVLMQSVVRGIVFVFVVVCIRIVCVFCTCVISEL